MSQINIRTDKFSKKEIRQIEEQIKEWSYDWITDIIYLVDSNEDNTDVTFILDEEDLGELLSVIYACGYESAFK